MMSATRRRSLEEKNEATVTSFSSLRRGSNHQQHPTFLEWKYIFSADRVTVSTKQSFTVAAGYAQVIRYVLICLVIVIVSCRQ